MILGITGGTGCGKTTLLRCIADCGGMIMDCDAIYHDLLKTDTAMLAAIEARFPGTVEEGGRNLKKLGALVYKDHEALEDLNRITHACVRREVEKTLSQKPKLAAIDAIALFESGLDIKEIQYLAGHATVNMTLRVYTHYQHESRQQSTAQKVCAAFG